MRFIKSLLAILGLASSLHAQQVNIAPVPILVKPITFNTNVSATDTVSSSGGYYDLLVDDQYNLAEQHNYFHYAQLITSEKGLDNVSTLTSNYDPEYQTLTFHIIRIIRKGQVIDQLRRDKIQLLRREENLERSVYDGSLTAVFNFENLQVGDIIEFATSYKGYNPIFENKYSRSLYFNYGVPVEKIYTRVVAEKNRKFNQKKFNNPPDAKEKIVGDRKEYEWQLDKIKALLFDEGRPGWHEPLSRIDFSEYNDWQEVVNWGNRVFARAAISSPAIEKQIAALRKENLEESANACIRFVQDEIRYLSFNDGIHGYQPHKAAQIFDQRYGDCKDKSVLLALMLNKLGIKSAPALVHSSSAKLINESLPTPRLFNHCIVQFTLNDSIYWVDPTISLQRGPLKKRFTPDYAYGLTLSSQSKGLSEIRYDAHDSEINIREKFDVGAVGTSARLEVDISYSGDEANSMRHYFRSTSRDEVTKSYLNFYANDYPDIEAARDVAYDDDELNNVFTTRERYNITRFWTYDSIAGKHTVSIYPRTLASYITKPGTKIRTMPYALVYPRHVKQQVTLQMPDTWDIENTEKSIETSGFDYKSAATYQDTLITLKYEYRTKKTHLEPSEINEYLKKIEDVQNDLTLNLYSYDQSKASSATKINYPFIIILAVSCVGFFFGVRKMYDYDPDAKPALEKHNSIGGWLILPAIGLCISPFRLVYDLYSTEYFNYTNWQILTDSNFAAYNPALGSLIAVEMIINFAILIYAIVLAVMFFQRRTSAPLFMMAFYIVTVLFVFTDSLVAESFGVEGFDDETTKTVIRGAIGAAIWVPYFLVSERVKGTFTIRKES
jgi:transglutaminase-like putative cysteine protease